MKKLSPPTLLTADAYAHDVADAITGATTRIALVATVFRDNDPRSERIINELCRAAERGVSVTICADTYTYLEPKEFFLRAPRQQPTRALNAIKLVRRLRKSGVKFRWLGRTTNVIISGRTHSKWTIVDDTVYSFGGVNMDCESFDNIDYMLRYTDADLAERLMREHHDIIRADKHGGAARSHAFALDGKTSVLVDGGLPFDSIIYRRAVALARKASQITLVSQYCPTGRLSTELKAKHATLYFNHWRNASLANKIIIRLGIVAAGQDTNYMHDTYLHAKFIIFTMPRGKRIALCGSHNFMAGSGRAGTREIALETSDPAIVDQLETFRRTHVESVPSIERG